jgi:hypothetical protein
MKKQNVIGLGFKARAGKDEVANHLVRNHGFTRVAFADLLKEACGTIFGLSRDQLYGSLKETEDPFWGCSPRHILQTVGTECLRKGFSDDVWVRALERKIQQNPGVDYVVSDVRFVNEAEMCLRLGGSLYRIERPGHSELTATTAVHASETQLLNFDKWTGIVVNDGTLEDLYEKVDELL